MSEFDPFLLSEHQSHVSKLSKRFVRLGVVGLGLILFLIGGGFLFVSIQKEALLGARFLEQGIQSFREGNTQQAKEHLLHSQQSFTRARRMSFGWGAVVLRLPKLPGIDRAATGVALIRGGERIAEAALITIDVGEVLRSSPQNSPLSNLSMLDILTRVRPYAGTLTQLVAEADQSLMQAETRFIPGISPERFNELKNALHLASNFLRAYGVREPLLVELLGGNGPRTYLFLFQNNHELRPTGGFIGSYAHLDIRDGRVRNFFVDGIFNPDGQLKENIVPPEPIQKISAAWSLHDSNWFPHFPTSAEKAIFFYEKTGGPTVDGVITFTPTILRHLLEVTGPITLEPYGITIDASNFMPLLQTEVEENYNREENNPKAVLSDLMNELLRRLMLVSNFDQMKQVGEALVTGLNERHILLYVRHAITQSLIEGAGWAGSILDTPYDYLSVVHTNVNGYKTDGVIDETLSHEVEIQPNGELIDTVSITRKHRGGKTPYEWWNKVNADYMRVYVPFGSILLSAEGMTREVVEAPLDYDALGFRRDADIVREEQAIRIDSDSGTRIGEDAGKTVFGNWVYVSPGESVSVVYRYRLPFRLDLGHLNEYPQSFSVLYQKQSGTERVTLKSTLRWSEGMAPVWQSRENLVPYDRSLSFESPLDENQFFGLVFR